MVSEYELYERGMVDVSKSGWVKYPGARVQFPQIEGDIAADIAVVGAGLAGSSLALHLAEGGAHVALVEAHEPGWGASGRNAGQVNAHHTLTGAAKSLPDGGEGFLDLFRREAGIPFALVEKHGIDCDAKQAGYLHIAAHRRFADAARKRAQEWIELGFPARYIEGEELARMTGTDQFYSAAFDPQSGSINPFYFTHGLASAAQKAGAKVFARSPVRKVHCNGGKWQVVCDGGTVQADIVVMCTGAYDQGARPEVTKAWCPQTAYVLTTKPLPEPLRSTFMPFGGSTQQLPGGHTVALDSLGRLHTALLPGRKPHLTEEPVDYLRRWLDRYYPQSRGIDVGIDAYWTGALAWSTDQLPRIFDLGPGLLALNCFSSVGNVPAPMMGKHLAEKLLTQRLDELVLPLQRPKPIVWRKRYEVLLRDVLIPLNRVAEKMRLL